MSNPFFSGRIPKNLNQRVEEHVAQTGKSKTEILISALAAYLDFPVEIPGSALRPEVTKEMFVSLEEQIAILHEMFVAVEKRIIILEESTNNTNNKKNDNNSENYVIDNTPSEKNLEQQIEPLTLLELDKGGSFAAADSPPSINVDNSPNNNKPVFVISSDNTISKAVVVYGPVNESQMAVWTKKDRSLFRKHRRFIEEKQLPLDTSLQIEIDGKSYRLIYIGEKKGSGRAAVKEWIAELVENDNSDNENKNLLSMLETKT